MNKELNPPITRLIEGYKEFKHAYFEESKALFQDLVKHGQKPKVLVIACCDARANPALLTQSKPGDLFVVHNVANLVPPYETDPRHHGTSAALEFAVKGLAVTDIVILGHRYCGGIRKLMESTEDNPTTDFISTWMDIAKPAKQRVLEKHPECSLDEQAHHCEKESLIVSQNNLMTFPWVKERVLDNRLTLHAWYFNLDTGVIDAYQPETKDFTPLTS